jgi:putative membrane protein
MDFNALLQHLIAAILFGAVGILMFVLALWVIRKITPFSIEKELAEDQNIALGIVLGAMMIGLALILGQAIGGS